MGIQERKEREKQLRWQQIQNAAKELFIVKGFHSTTMEDIAQKTELSVATIYQYFRNKGDLYCSLNLITLRYLFDEVEKVYNNDMLTVEEKVIGFKDAMYKTYKREPLILRIILHVQLEDTLLKISSELLDKLNNLSQKIMTMISDVYEEGILQKKFRNGNGMAHADIIWAIFTGLIMWEEAKKKLNTKKDFFKPTLDRAFDVFCWGIKRR